MSEEKNETQNLTNSSFPYKYQIITGALLLLGIFTLSLGIGFYYFSADKGEDIKIVEAAVSSPAVEKIVVHVDGAVSQPGVYEVKAGARVSDAIGAAGGLLTTADSKKLNLAAKISDGQKVFIPKVGESSGTSTTLGVSTQAVGYININSASSTELDKLPGIGPVTSEKIINGRPYSSVDELLSKKVVSKSVFEKIKDLVVAN